MYYYLGLFAWTVMLTVIAENKYKHYKTRKGHFYSALVILSLGLFAGMRSSSVGIDVSVYVTPYIEVAKNYSSFFVYMTHVAIEPAFGLLTYINGRLFSTPFFTLLISQVLTIGPIYIVIYRNRHSLSMPFCLLIYELLFFNVTLCIMRQFIAAAFIMLAVTCYQGNKRRFIITALVAVSFHISSAICILVYIVLALLQKAKLRTIVNIVVIAAVLVVLCFLEPLLQLAANMGVVPARYYAVFIAQSNLNQISVVEKALQGVTIIIPVLISRIRNNKILSQSAYYALFGFVLSFAAIKSQYLLRLSFSFEVYSILALSMSRESFRTRNSKRVNVLTYELLVSSVMLIYWWLIFIAWNYYGTAQFMFR